MKKWNELPLEMQVPEVKRYYDILDSKRLSLVLKRGCDVVLAAGLLVVLAIPMGVIAILIKQDSEGPVFYRQLRITTNGKPFYIHKFRTMVQNAEAAGTSVTVGNDSRITKMGSRLRNCRLDELPQLIDILHGTMSFVGTRPEAAKYVAFYTDEMKATLLLPAGVTSEASILFKNEAELLDGAQDADQVYIHEILPQKMEYNLKSLENFSLLNDLKTMVKTVFAVLK